MSREEVSTAIREAPEMTEADVVDEGALLAELAALPPIEYDRKREDAARRLGVRVSTLDAEVERRRAKEAVPDTGSGTALTFEDPEPWPEPMDGSELLGELVATFRRFVVLPDGAAEALALWVIHSHAHAAAFVSPILAITSPEKRCGKTTLLTLLQAVVRRPLPTANATASTVFRVIEAHSPTLLIDEADTFLRDNDDLRGVLNSGHTRTTAYILRAVGDDHEPRAFRTWAPKAIALIGRMHPTLTDRSIEIRMRRRRPDEMVERLRLDRLDELEPLRRKAFTWAEGALPRLPEVDPDVPQGLNDRAADNWRALLAIADAMGGPWPERARRACLTLAGEEEDEAVGVMLLADIRNLFDRFGADRLPSDRVVEELAKLEDRPWPEWKNGRPITVRQVARLLKPFGVRPKQIRFGERNLHGYELKAFEDAFSRYLPSTPLPDPLQRYNAGLAPRTGDPEPLREDYGVADRIRGKPCAGAGCSGVADEIPPKGRQEVLL